MSAGTSTIWRTSNITRLTVLLIFVTAIFLFRDLWLPQRFSMVPSSPDFEQKQTDIEPEPKLQTEIPTSVKEPPIEPSIEPSTEPPAEPPVEPPIKPSVKPQPPPTSQSCKTVPGADRVLVLLKTGATELYQKLPTHFATTFQCVPNYMIFSDLKQKFAGVPIHDAIAPVTAKTRKEHEDFQLYRKLQDWRKQGQDVGELKGDSGWNLDKWKFLPMLHEAFNSASKEIDWFVVMEADSIISWTNLLQWLKTMDPTNPFYLGAQNVIGDTTFAHGGSGIVISRRAAEMMKNDRDSVGHDKYDTIWEDITSPSCCGDEIVARAFLAIGIPLTPSWPLIQGETVNTVDWTSNHWCTPPVTWHHVSPIEVDTMWQFERDWVKEHGWDKPYLYRDVFATLVEPHIQGNQTSWNNISKDRRIDSGDKENFESLADWEKEAVDSESACAAACLRMPDDECIQWMFTPGRCALGKDIRFGKRDEHEDEHWTSGWILERIENFRNEFVDCDIRWAG